MSGTQEPQFTIYSHASGPNGWRVVYVLKALSLTYRTIYLDFTKGEHKSAEYLSLNPNGRIPTLIDHSNNDITIFESNAILTYLVEKYDHGHRISAESEEGRIQQLQWLFFQGTGQGPYFGQAAWFKLFHPEKIPSAIERYEKEILRVLQVLESVLESKEWLNGEKATIADIAWVSWNSFAFEALVPEEVDIPTQLPRVWRWHQRLLALPYIAEAIKEKEALGNEA
ncbi:glutathione S-transferase [Leucosporidium creatinivorum]|uniref:glutathione transferase n=1 Tax=Leucosporidium creatinivorum TaxID=106004 RepID=A0A1Y2FN29_9BASI|nr:glutathione S-transferase [Leucosporidium creatinivorum]